MADTNSFTIVIPTRDDPAECTLLLENLLGDNAKIQMPLQVVFLANDTGPEFTQELRKLVGSSRFEPLKPLVLSAKQDYATVEENVRHTLGEHLEAVGERFLIVGNSDKVDLRGLSSALEYLRLHHLDLLLVGVMNRESYKGIPLRQLYATPQHITAKNQLSSVAAHGESIWLDALAAYGPLDYLAYLGCQIYTKKFFEALCGVMGQLPEPLYAHSVATLELMTRRAWTVGFYPEIVATREDHLQYGPASPETPPDSWLYCSRVERGLSRHLLMSVVTNSLHLSDRAFQLLVNSQTVSMVRGASQYRYSNFLSVLVSQTGEFLEGWHKGPAYVFSPAEQRDLNAFSARLRSADIGLAVEQREPLCIWLQQLGTLSAGSDPGRTRQLALEAMHVVELLGLRQGMEQWAARLAVWTLEVDRP